MNASLGVPVAMTLAALAAKDIPSASSPVSETPILMPAVQEPASRHIDLAICLDTSGSMSGLIDAAKQRLWSVVNDLALAEPEPVLRVSLLTYGNDGHNPENGWVRVDSGLTFDLDGISQKLFALTTNGGTELVGRVVNSATEKLEWSNEPGALKMIIVCGNETADQDQQVRFPDACKAAITQDIQVHSIYCGGPTDADAASWAQVAKLADGAFATIDHNNGLVTVDTPFDVQLMSLSSAVNATYIPIGASGNSAWVNQRVQDANNAGLNNDAAVNRARTKAGKLYKNSWDLVEQFQQEDFDWAKVKVEDLPEVMRSMTAEERVTHVGKQVEERNRIQGEIHDLGRKRDAWLAAYKQLNGMDEDRGFDSAIRGAVRDNASSRGFEFKEAPKMNKEELEKLMEEILESAPEAAAAAANPQPPQAFTSGGPANGQQIRGGQQRQQVIMPPRPASQQQGRQQQQQRSGQQSSQQSSQQSGQQSSQQSGQQSGQQGATQQTGNSQGATPPAPPTPPAGNQQGVTPPAEGQNSQQGQTEGQKKEAKPTETQKKVEKTQETEKSGQTESAYELHRRGDGRYW